LPAIFGFREPEEAGRVCLIDGMRDGIWIT